MTCKPIILSGALLGLLVGPMLRADDIVVEGLKYPNARVIGLDGQTLKVLISGRQQAIDLGRVTGLAIRSLPQLQQADQALADGQPARAVALLDQAERLCPPNQQYLKPLILARRIAALDAAGQFDRALREYCRLVLAHPQPYFLDRAPAGLPADPAARKTALQTVQQAAAQARQETVKQKLLALARSLQAPAHTTDTTGSGRQLPGRQPAGSPAPGPAAQPAAGTAPQVSPGQYRQILQGLQTTIERGDHDKALELIDNLFRQKELGRQNLPEADLTYLRAMAIAGKGQLMPAALEYLRVAILWPDSPNAVSALVQAGQCLLSLGDPASARKLWQEALDKATDAPTRSRIQRLLQSAPAR